MYISEHIWLFHYEKTAQPILLLLLWILIIIVIIIHASFHLLILPLPGHFSLWEKPSFHSYLWNRGHSGRSQRFWITFSMLEERRRKNIEHHESKSLSLFSTSFIFLKVLLQSYCRAPVMHMNIMGVQQWNTMLFPNSTTLITTNKLPVRSYENHATTFQRVQNEYKKSIN